VLRHRETECHAANVGRREMLRTMPVTVVNMDATNPMLSPP
jgi:hypothetical protein